MKRRMWSEIKALKVAIGVTSVSGTEILVESHLKSEKKTTNRTVEDEPGASKGVKKHLQ